MASTQPLRTARYTRAVDKGKWEYGTLEYRYMDSSSKVYKPLGTTSDYDTALLKAGMTVETPNHYTGG